MSSGHLENFKVLFLSFESKGESLRLFSHRAFYLYRYIRYNNQPSLQEFETSLGICLVHMQYGS